MAPEGSYDYLHTRASLLKNHLRSEGSTLYSFVQSNNVGMQLAKFQASKPSDGLLGEVLSACESHFMPSTWNCNPTWQFCAEVRLQQQPADIDQSHMNDPPLDCSVAQVQHQSMCNSTEDWPILMSSGRGDMVGPLQHMPGTAAQCPLPNVIISCLALICKNCAGVCGRKSCFLVPPS